MYIQSKKALKKRYFLSEAAVKKARIRIRDPMYGSKDSDLYQNVTDPEHC